MTPFDQAFRIAIGEEGGFTTRTVASVLVVEIC